MEHRARKRFGQNFLQDTQIIAQIVRAIRPGPDDAMVEIGPGLGAITAPLLEEVGHLDVVELDRDLIPRLEQRFVGKPLTIHPADALKFDFAALAVERGAKLRVVGNLPYNISTPLIFHLLDARTSIRDMHFMLQKEVVERLAAAPGDSAYGRLGVMVQYFCYVEPLIEVPPESFHPAPKVDSAVVRLIPHARPPVEVADPERLSALVAQAFSQRRKTLRNTLKGWLDAATIEACDIDPGRRPETLSLAEYARLCAALPPRGGPVG